ncbi:MAG: cytochrome c oxidase assembly protein [Burkholderiaceae bacterium]|nr:MAG: cytochrome c oxidase assembly protein [Burkholderiaceae bacterium]
MNVTDKLRQHLSWRMLKKLVVIAALMFGFAYALVPLYRKICEITGINVLTQVDAGAKEFAANTQVDESRSITVVFDANAQGPWRIRPVKNSLQVHPGALTTMVYEIANQQHRRMVGQAIPSYVPQLAAKYFKKVECFCFQQQTLAANEAKQFPVVFVIDPAVPKSVDTITLSYTFFEVAGATAK